MHKPRKTKLQAILNILAAVYPDAHCELNFSSPFQLLIATMLSAQATDKKVNLVTARLFAKYRTPQDFLSLTQTELENEIKEIGLYHNKAINILATCQKLVSEYHGEVPQDIHTLTALPGVGQKTANVVAANAFGIPALAVDTHVFRVANRLGLAQAATAKQVELQLTALIPRDLWIKAHHWLIWHGRRICHARRPKCRACPLAGHCEYGQSDRKPS